MDASNPPPPLDDERVAHLRSLLPATAAGAYLNTGTAGPLPTPVIAAMTAELALQLALARSGPAHLERYLTLAAEDRSALATMIGCRPEEVTLTHSTTEGMNAVTLGVGWRAGDNAVTTDLEHPGALFPLYVARDRFGVEIRWAEIAGLDDTAIVDAIGAAMTERTRLVSVSHVSFQIGQLLPIARIAEVARAHGALLLVDGAQSFGAVDLDITALGCDAYSASGQKWLLGPEGTGALYCNAQVLDHLGLVAASYGTAQRYGRTDFTPHSDGRRLEFGTTNPVGFVGQIAAGDFLTTTVGVPAAAARAHALTGRAIDRLAAIPGVRVLTPPDRHATLVSFAIEGVGSDRAVEELARSDIFVRSIRELDAVRASIGFFTTDLEIDTLAEGVGAIRGR